MSHIDSRFVVAALLVAIVVSLGGTTFVLVKLAELSGNGVITGFAVTGEAKINISKTVDLDVDPANNTVDFGICTSPTDQEYSINSEWTEEQIRTNTGVQVNCTQSNLPAGIVVRNIGNVDINVTVESDRTGSNVVGSNGVLSFRQDDTNIHHAGCSENMPAYTEFAAASTEYQACVNLTYGPNLPKVMTYINFTLPVGARTSGQEIVTLTFHAYELI